MKISEVAALTNTSTKTLRFYENSGLLPPPARTASGYRNYGPEIVDRLRFIHRGQAAGLALQEVRQILAIHDRGEAPCAHVRQLLSTRIDEVRPAAKRLPLRSLKRVNARTTWSNHPNRARSRSSTPGSASSPMIDCPTPVIEGTRADRRLAEPFCWPHRGRAAPRRRARPPAPRDLRSIRQLWLGSG